MDFGFNPSAIHPLRLQPSGSDSEDSDSDSSSNDCNDAKSASSSDKSDGSDDHSEDCDATMSEEELRKLTKDQLKAKLKDLGMKVSGKKDELIERLLHPQLHQKPVAWRKSKAKALLFKLLHDKKSKLYSMTAREVYESHSWFQQYPFERFKDNFANLKVSVESSLQIIDEDIKIVTEELKNFPQSNQSIRGYPRWDKHAAKDLLEDDIRNGKYTLGQAKQFQRTRAEYLCFPLDVFRYHIHQERRKQRELPMKVVQRNKKARKKHQKEVEEQQMLYKYNIDLDHITEAFANF
jgi:hypothetical protein